MSEENEKPPSDSRTVIEKHALTVLMGLLIALFAWGGNKLDRQSEMLGRLDERVNERFIAMKNTIEDLGRRLDKMDDRRSRSDGPYRGDRR